MNNSEEITDFNPLENFEGLEDTDSVLNTYKAIGRDRDGLYLVMDDSHDCYFYPPTCFEIVSDEYDILSHRSVYFSSTTGKNELIFAYRRINKMMKTEKI